MPTRERLLIAVAMTTVVIGVAEAAEAAQSPLLSAANGNTQRIAVSFTPQKLSKTVAEAVTLDLSAAAGTTDPAANGGAPIPTVEAVVDLPKGTKFFSRGYPTCNAGTIRDTSTEAALEACEKAKVGDGEGTADLVVGDRIVPVRTAITAFNGKPVGRKPVILLHTYSPPPVQTTLLLAGAVSEYDKEGFGPRLDLTVPLIAGGQGAITSFHVKIFKKFKHKGQIRSYVSATCATKKLRARGKFVFEDGESLTPALTQRCAQKPDAKVK